MSIKNITALLVLGFSIFGVANFAHADSRTGHTAAPGHYQPQNKVEVEQARAMDEWMEDQ